MLKKYLNKKVIGILLILLLTTIVTISLVFTNQKPNYSNIPIGQRVGEYAKPSIVRVVSGVVLQWEYVSPSNGVYLVDTEVQNFLKSRNYTTNRASWGSGAIINSTGYIVTNAHVVELNYGKEKDNQIILEDGQFIVKSVYNKLIKTYPDIPLNSLYNYVSASLKMKSISKLLKVYLPDGSSPLDAEIKTYGAPIGEGKDVAVLKVESKNLPSLSLSDSDKVELQSTIWVCGYPSAADSELLSNDSTYKSTINDGKISVKDKKSSQGAPILQINAAATTGNSGGPVVNEDGHIIGLLTFRSEQNENATQGFNFVVPSNTVKEFIAQAGITNDESETTKLYKESLQLYWAGYYNEALLKFEAVKRLFPNHSEVNQYISNCQEKSSTSKIYWPKYKIASYVTYGISISAILLIIFFIFIKKGTVSAEDTKEVLNTTNIISDTNSEIVKAYLEPIETVIEKPIKTKLHRLYCISGPLSGMIFDFNAYLMCIGREPRSCKVLFPPDLTLIARQHCTISYRLEDDTFLLTDLNSPNGTYLGSGEKLDPSGSKVIKSGDSFYVGSEEYLFEVWLE